MTKEKQSKGRRQPVSEPVWLSQPVTGLNELAAMWPTGKKGLCRQAEILGGEYRQERHQALRSDYS